MLVQELVKNKITSLIKHAIILLKMQVGQEEWERCYPVEIGTMRKVM